MTNTRAPAVPTTREFRAMNTDWWIGVRADVDLAPFEEIVHRAEAAYSRFRAGSLVTLLNRERLVVDTELASLVSRALELGGAFGGAFDIRVGSALAAAGYDRSFELLPAQSGGGCIAPPVEMLEVEVVRDEVRLHGSGAIDLGGIAKGWTIDRIARALEDAGVRDYLIDGGGDLRAGGAGVTGEAWPVGVGDGLALRLSDRAVCTSSTAKRRWNTPLGEAHHIIAPACGESSMSGVTQATVVASDATTADALATALVANPDSALWAMVALDVEALLERDGRWEMTTGMGELLA